MSNASLANVAEPVALGVREHARDALFGNVALCLLSWKANVTLRHTLASFADVGILDLFAERMIFFNEIDGTDREVAKEYGFEALGSPTNVGIFGGVDRLVAAAHASHILFVENDCPLATSRAGFISMMRSALDDMEKLGVEVFQMRSRREPGEPFWRRARYERRFRVLEPIGGGRRNPAPPLWRRMYEDMRRPALRGCAIYAEEMPTVRHPGIVSQSDNGNWITTSEHLNWSNCCYLARREFLRDVVLERVRTHPSTIDLNGHQDIEAAMKRDRWWRRQKILMGQSEPGPFTHIRLDR